MTCAARFVAQRMIFVHDQQEEEEKQERQIESWLEQAALNEDQ